MSLNLGLESLGIGGTVSVEQAHIDMLEAQNDCTVAFFQMRDALKDLTNFNEIMNQLTVHASAECYAFASDLLGFPVASMEEDKPTPTPLAAGINKNAAKTGLWDKTKNFFKKLWLYIRKFGNWIRLTFNDLLAKTGLVEWNGEIMVSFDPKRINNVASNIELLGGYMTRNPGKLGEIVTKLIDAMTANKKNDIYYVKSYSELKAYKQSCETFQSAAETVLKKLKDEAKPTADRGEYLKVFTRVEKFTAMLAKDIAKLSAGLSKYGRYKKIKAEADK